MKDTLKFIHFQSQILISYQLWKLIAAINAVLKTLIFLVIDAITKNQCYKRLVIFSQWATDGSILKRSVFSFKYLLCSKLFRRLFLSKTRRALIDKFCWMDNSKFKMKEENNPYNWKEGETANAVSYMKKLSSGFWLHRSNSLQGAFKRFLLNSAIWLKPNEFSVSIHIEHKCIKIKGWHDSPVILKLITLV